MAPKKRTTRASPATSTTTTPVTNALLKALIDQGVADALVVRDANRSMNSDDSHNSGTGVRRQAPLARECTYSDFIKCKPLYFKGTERVIELTQWFERMKTVFRISNRTECWSRCCICNDLDKLEKKMIDKYCPKGKIKMLEVEMWNLKVKGTDVVSYNQRFQELALMCVRMFPEESDKIEKYVGGLPDMIHGSVMASKPKTMQDAIEFTTKLMDKRSALLLNVKLRTRGNMIIITKLNNNLPRSKCTVKCTNCKKVGHLTRDCRSHATTNNQRNLTCYECGNQGHYRNDCPELKNQNHENQAGGTGARGMVHALGGGEINQDLNDIEDYINA
nr:hypothetical protein [Tanacetum cinerariifolium]